MTGRISSDMTTLRDALAQLESDYAAGEFSGGGYKYVEATPSALRAALDALSAPITDAQVEAAYNAFWDLNPTSPDGRDAMRAALEAARDAS